MCSKVFFEFYSTCASVRDCVCVCVCVCDFNQLDFQTHNNIFSRRFWRGEIVIIDEGKFVVVSEEDGVTCVCVRCVVSSLSL